MQSMAALWFVEGLSGACILLPVVLSGKSLGSGVLCIILGALFWCLAMELVMKWSVPGRDAYELAARLGGRNAAMVFWSIGFWFFLSQAAVFLNWWTELVHGYLLPMVPDFVICLIPLGLGIFLGKKQLVERAAIGRAAAPVLIVLMGLLMAAAGISSEPYDYPAAGARFSDHIFAGSYEVLLCMGGVFLPFLSGHMERKSNVGRMAKWAGCMGMAVAGGIYAATVISSGGSGLGKQGFPQVDAMYAAVMTGDLGQYLGVVFVLLLLVGITMGIAGAFWNIREICVKLCPEVVWFVKNALQEFHGETISGKRAGKVRVLGKKFAEEYAEEYALGFWGGKQNRGKGGKILEWLWDPAHGAWTLSILAAYLLAVGFLDAETAIFYYRAYNVQVLVSLTLLFYVVLAMRGRRKMRRVYNLSKKDCRF